MTKDSVARKNTNLHVDETIENGGSGAYSILGYEYQIDVSVWLALDLVIASKLAQEVILEPATEEDIEADLEHHEPSRVTTAVSMNGYRLIVQAKRRTGDAWTVPTLRALLKHGKTRKSAVKRLEESSARYLLVTSAGLNGGTRDFRVRRAGSWPHIEKLPVTIQDLVPDNAVGRIAIIGDQNDERLETDIKTLLTENFRIPRNRLTDCRLALRAEARARIMGAGGGRWKRPELEQLIRRYDGYIASSPELDNYVYPTNWAELHAALNTQYAALIVGQSGTGKTMATRKLYEELRELIPGLTRVPITHGPQQLISDTTEPPVLYDIEDPWGKYNFDPSSRPWNDQLSRFFSEARHNRLFVATSRLDVANTTGALGTLRPWIIGLETEHYGKPQRKLLYRTRIDALPRKLQSIARKSEKQVLSELATPLEIQKFFDALPTIEVDRLRNPAALISEAIRHAHQNSIEQTVVDQIEARNDVRAAAVIWGLLKANEKLSIGLLRQIEENLSELEAHYEQGVSPLLAFFVAARNLRQTESTVTYYHPRVEAGIERALLCKRLIVRKTLKNLIEIMLSPDGPGQDWGAGASARLLLAADRTPDLKPKPSDQSQIKIDKWLTIELSKAGKEFETNLKLAASAGSQNNDVSEVARFLLHRPNRTFGSMDFWEAPLHDEAWYARMRSNIRVKALLETFIQEVLPDHRDYFGKWFVTELERLAPDLTTSFLAAAEKVVHYGVICTKDVIAEGALKDIHGFEKIIDIAVGVVTPSEIEIAENVKTSLAIVNGEYSDEYIEHLGDNDNGWTAKEFIDAYVLHVRKIFGWERIVEHKHSKPMLFYWLRAMANDKTLLDVDEVSGAFNAAYNTEHEDSLWHILAKTWSTCFSQKLFERIVKGHAVQSVRHSALCCMIKHAPEQLARASDTLLQTERIERFIELAIDLGNSNQQSSYSPVEGEALIDVSSLVTGTPAAFQEISIATNALSIGRPPILSLATIELLKRVKEPSEIVRVARLNLTPYFQVFVADDVHWLLAHTTENKNAVVAVKMAIQYGMHEEVKEALSHRFSDVVALALHAIASPMEAPLPEEILALSHVKGNPVKSKLVDILEAKPHADHLATLLFLAHDRWSRNSSRYGEEADYPLAKAAVAAISKLGAILKDTADGLYSLAIGTSDSNLRYAIFRTLVKSADSSFQIQLFELATNPGRLSYRRAAAQALLSAYEQVTPEIISKISIHLLITRIEDVASRLFLLLSFRGGMEDLLAAAKDLATHPKRKVFLLLAIWAVNDRHPSTASQIASMLPANHSAVDWALEGASYTLNEKLLEDLGDSLSVEQVLLFMQPKKAKS